MELRSLIWKVLSEQTDQNTINLKNKYVGEGKPLTEDDFNKIVEVSGNKFYLVSWLTKKVGQAIIKAEDIYKYKEYFEIFEKNKNKGKFKFKDIHLYKTPEDVLDFIEEAIKVREGDVKFEQTVGKDNYVSPNDIRKLEETGGIKYLGIFDGYQVFQIFKVAKSVWKMYRDILGKCKGRSRGAKIDICTIGDYDYFRQYLTDPKGSSYFLLYNLEDPKSPYQLHYESGQFMDKNDSSRIGINQIKFFEWIGDRVPRYSLEQDKFPGDFEIPVKGKGFQDDKKRKQGLWKSFQDGQLNSITTYVNDKERGPFIEYFYDGKILRKGTNGPKGFYIGDYEEYSEPNLLAAKGTFDSDGNRIGVWFELVNDNGEHKQINYDTVPIEVSGITKAGDVRFVSYLRTQREGQPYGDIIFFYPSGSVYAMGKRGVTYPQLGPWTYYNPDGSIKAEGKFVKGKREGQWTDVVRTKKGKFILVANFSHGWPEDKINVFDSNGEFIKKVSPKNIKPENYWFMDPKLYEFRNYK